jgi:hypothetical protein
MAKITMMMTRKIGAVMTMMRAAMMRIVATTAKMAMTMID